MISNKNITHRAAPQSQRFSRSEAKRVLVSSLLAGDVRRPVSVAPWNHLFPISLRYPLCNLVGKHKHTRANAHKGSSSRADVYLRECVCVCAHMIKEDKRVGRSGVHLRTKTTWQNKYQPFLKRNLHVLWLSLYIYIYTYMQPSAGLRLVRPGLVCPYSNNIQSA